MNLMMLYGVFMLNISIKFYIWLNDYGCASYK